MGTVAPVVSEIFEKTGAYVNTMFWKIYYSFFKIRQNFEQKYTDDCLAQGSLT